MSFIKNPKLALTDMTDSTKLEKNLERIEKDEQQIINKIKSYDSDIDKIRKEVSDCSCEIGKIVEKLSNAKSGTIKFNLLIKKRNSLRKRQHNLVFKQEAELRKKQDELITYYKDLIEAVRILSEMKELKKEQAEKVHVAIKGIQKHLSKFHFFGN